MLTLTLICNITLLKEIINTKKIANIDTSCTFLLQIIVFLLNLFSVHYRQKLQNALNQQLKLGIKKNQVSFTYYCQGSGEIQYLQKEETFQPLAVNLIPKQSSEEKKDTRVVFYSQEQMPFCYVELFFMWSTY